MTAPGDRAHRARGGARAVTAGADVVVGSRSARESRRAGPGQPGERRAVAQRGGHPAAHAGPPGLDDRRAVGRRRDRRVRGGLGRADALPGPVGPRPVRLSHVSDRPQPGHRGRADARHRGHRLAGARLPVVRRRLRRVLLHAAPGRWPTGWPAASCTRCPSSTTGTPSRATSRASSSSSCRSTAWSAASSWPGASCWPAPPRRARELEARQRRMTEEQASLRRVATAVAAGSPPAGDLRARLARRRAPAGRRLRRHRPLPGAPTASTVLGRWTHDEHGARRSRRHRRRAPGQPARPPAPRRAPSRATGSTASTTACAWPRRCAAAPRCGARSSSWPPIRTSSPPGAEERLHDYADLIATAVANAEDRARLDAEAATDALTGLPNHRAFRERLTEEVARAQRHDRPLTVALIDVDGFRDLNDRAGLDVGRRGAGRDRRAAARRHARGGRPRAHGRRRVRRHLRRERSPSGAAARRPRAARDRRGAAAPPAARDGLDRALRPRGRERRATRPCGAPTPRCSGPRSTGATCAGSTTRRWCASSTSASARASSIAPRRSSGLRALARAIDAKDPATQEHSERVAALSARLAVARGWAPDRVALLRDAALLHDVGKIGVPDAILLKDGPLDDDEFAIVREHAVLGARIVGDVLDEEQIAWIAGHHERPDGSGYPGGAQGRRRSARGRRAARAGRRVGRDGLRSLLQRADDARGRAGRGPRAAPGRQFDGSPPSRRSTQLAARGDLMPAAARLHQPTA